MTTAAQFWIRLEAAERARIAAVRIKATGNHRVASNDEPESTSMRSIREAGQADARDVMRNRSES
jgi:hypothetical protein